MAKAEYKMQPLYGVVLMLDALGSRGLRIEESIRFIEQRDILLKDAEPFSREMFNVFSDMIERKHGKKNEPPKIITFGDTIVFMWNIPRDFPEKENALYFAGVWSILAIGLGIRKGILLRGSISMGEYIYHQDKISGSTLLGACRGNGSYGII